VERFVHFTNFSSDSVCAISGGRSGLDVADPERNRARQLPQHLRERQPDGLDRLVRHSGGYDHVHPHRLPVRPDRPQKNPPPPDRSFRDRLVLDPLLQVHSDAVLGAADHRDGRRSVVRRRPSLHQRNRPKGDPRDSRQLLPAHGDDRHIPCVPVRQVSGADGLHHLLRRPPGRLRRPVRLPARDPGVLPAEGPLRRGSQVSGAAARPLPQQRGRTGRDRGGAQGERREHGLAVARVHQKGERQGFRDRVRADVLSAVQRHQRRHFVHQRHLPLGGGGSRRQHRRHHRGGVSSCRHVFVVSSHRQSRPQDFTLHFWSSHGPRQSLSGGVLHPQDSRVYRRRLLERDRFRSYCFFVSFRRCVLHRSRTHPLDDLFGNLHSGNQEYRQFRGRNLQLVPCFPRHQILSSSQTWRRRGLHILRLFDHVHTGGGLCLLHGARNQRKNSRTSPRRARTLINCLSCRTECYYCCFTRSERNEDFSLYLYCWLPISKASNYYKLR
jgi:hypothetical protein